MDKLNEVEWINSSPRRRSRRCSLVYNKTEALFMAWIYFHAKEIASDSQSYEYHKGGFTNANKPKQNIYLPFIWYII